MDETRRKHDYEEIIHEIFHLQPEVEANALISEPRLKEIEVAASELAFSDKGAFPIRFFKSIDYEDCPLDPFTIVLETSKGNVAEVGRAYTPINERQVYAESVANHVGALLLSDVLQRCRIEDKFVSDASAYWSVLQGEANRLMENGLTPLLILDSQTTPGWVWECINPKSSGAYQRSSDLVIRKGRDEHSGNYVADYNDIQVYTNPIDPVESMGVSILLTREAFSRVKFRKYGEAVFVNANVVEIPDSQARVDLELTLERYVEIGCNDLVRLCYVCANS